ncbi:MerR family transcriptional regulator [Streptomyces tirandamycinicus]|uniref:MerR family transcriptional regulator n=1 Tax=Streptomyces tirandamycinicus TaxID=2174846 RepID=A0A2S1SYU9_9ACTN|nr:MerR family transcriptional regulator [Streptomyces tirandamycinicus]AWI31600.1 MerR family transcriptional regulator [Streptomyces tirandamycinicus]
MPTNAPLTIGELAERAGVTVKTVRFYSDRGLLPESGRSTGGHRRYGPEALDRLRLIRSLRELGLPLPEVRRIVDSQDDDRTAGTNADTRTNDVLEAAITGQLQKVGSQLSALRWQEASLRLLRDCAAGERAERLRLVGAVAVPPSTAPMARFWRYWLPPRLPARVVSAFLDQAVPHLPDDPTPTQVWAFARMHALVSANCSGSARPQPAVHLPDRGYHPAVLYDGLGEAYALASAELRAGRPPWAGEALDCFVSAYAVSRGTRDTPAFRRLLRRQLAADPRIDVYWQLTAELSTPPGAPPEPNPGSAHDWLCTALNAGTARPAG